MKVVIRATVVSVDILGVIDVVVVVVVVVVALIMAVTTAIASIVHDKFI